MVLKNEEGCLGSHEESTYFCTKPTERERRSALLKRESVIYCMSSYKESKVRLLRAPTHPQCNNWRNNAYVKMRIIYLKSSWRQDDQKVIGPLYNTPVPITCLLWCTAAAHSQQHKDSSASLLPPSSWNACLTTFSACRHCISQKSVVHKSNLNLKSQAFHCPHLCIPLMCTLVLKSQARSDRVPWVPLPESWLVSALLTVTHCTPKCALRASLAACSRWRCTAWSGSSTPWWRSGTGRVTATQWLVNSKREWRWGIKRIR